ncbi:hypothetical protein MNBD_PLANCTO02-2341, partial [hydrothermal vent metagenome]
AALKVLTEHALDPVVKKTTPNFVSRAVLVLSRSMRNEGIPLEQRMRWLDGVSKSLDHFEANTKGITAFSLPGYLNGIRYSRIAIVQSALEDKQMKRAKRLLRELRKGIKPQNESIGTLTRFLRAGTKILNDKQELENFEQWASSLSESNGLLTVKWPQIDVRNDFRLDKKSNRKKLQRPEVPFTDIIKLAPNNRIRSYQSISPIATDGNRVYLMVAKPWKISVHWTYGSGGYSGLNFPQIVTVNLDNSGRPIGKYVKVPVQNGRIINPVWKPFHKIPQPSAIRSYGKLFVQCHQGKLYMGTQENGLLVFNPKTEKWKVFGSKQGLPSNMISSFFFLDDDRMYIAGGRFAVESTHFILHLKTGKVKLLHKANETKEEYFRTRLVPMWLNGKKLADSLYTNLLSSHPVKRPDWRKIPIGNALDAEIIYERRFFTSSKGLYEYDIQGKAIRSWITQSSSGTGTSNAGLTIPRKGLTPQRGHYMVKTKNLLVFVGQNKGIVAFNPKTNIWYGPLGNWNVHYAIGSKNGFWLAHNSGGETKSIANGTIYISEKDFIQAAIQAGRASSPATYRKLIKKQIERMSPLDQAKTFIMFRQNKEALETLNEIISQDPKNAEALLLQGFTLGRHGLRQPKQALKSYRALAKHSDKSAQVTGLFYEMMIHRYAKNYPEILRVSRLLIDKYPNLNRRLHGGIIWWKNHATKKLAKQKKPKEQ